LAAGPGTPPAGCPLREQRPDLLGEGHELADRGDRTGEEVAAAEDEDEGDGHPGHERSPPAGPRDHVDEPASEGGGGSERVVPDRELAPEERGDPGAAADLEAADLGVGNAADGAQCGAA